MSELKTSEMPLTIVRTKFKGLSPRFYYAAFFMRAQDIPFGFGDVEAAEIKFWQSYNFTEYAIGTGNTAGAATKDLYRRHRFITELNKTGGARYDIKSTGE